MKNTYTPAEALQMKIEFKQRVLARLNAMKQSQLPTVKDAGVSPDHLALGKKLFTSMVQTTSERLSLEFKDTFAERLSLSHYGQFTLRERLQGMNELETEMLP